MKAIITILFLILASTLFAQKAIKSFEPYTSKSGHVFHVGDTLHLAKASMQDRSFKCAILVPKKSSAMMAGSSGLILNTFYENTDWIIDYFVTYSGMPIPAMFAAFSINNKVYHAELMIDCAIAEGEIVFKKE
jgi:hypothetical protein